MLTTIKNQTVSITADTRGAELQSIRGENGISYLWNGDPAYWHSRAPILFPFVGSLRNNRAQSSAGEICLPPHGLTRNADWKVESSTDKSITYLLNADKDTLEKYPYHFEIRVRYTLEKNSVTTVFHVCNAGSEIMPFCLGAHPGFNVPLAKNETFEDYTIEFEQPETVDCPQINTNGLVQDGIRNRLLENSTSFCLNHILFRSYALIFDRLKSRSVKLVSGKSNHGVQLDFKGMDYLVIWSPSTDSPFLCIEPWTGTATQESEDDIFEHKQGIRLLAAGEEAEYSYTISIF